jgi:cyclopropane fatty-acyl-phospholipid synthase-like methyltransferase
MASAPSKQDIVLYYEGKTEGIIRRYGPGPRVHYHAGLIDEQPQPTASTQVLRQRLVAAQELMMYHAAEVWRAESAMRGEILDVGCGLGGGAIFWAQEFGARVTAVTFVASHANWVSRFATQAGVESQVRPLVCDALEVPGRSSFDAVVAVDSSGYLSRGPWFRRVSSLLRPAGRVLILDCFLASPEYEEPFNRHWCTHIGTIDEYLAAASRAGLRVEVTEDLSRRTKHFWTTTLAMLEAEAGEKPQSSNETPQRETSIRMHKLVRQGLVDGGLTYALLSFSKGKF